ncbi:hypothetical protein TrST_g5115 [Triparma strigata]|uniref:Protein BTN n=1 Tax=Triparma strigata TaxID=1606541 RepID=A0A9W7EN13_9STRA|nr:hypothetical protein TrST_g5115 [Triparma strigata]
MGLLNNISFVICAASAVDILPSSIGAVYLANSFPSLLIRLSAPYWFDRVTYAFRMNVCFVLYTFGFLLVGLSPSSDLKLVGVALISSQCGLGETSMLALQSRYHGSSLTLWSSGTGAAGILGYFYVVMVHRWLGFSNEVTLVVSTFFGVCYFFVFRTFDIPEMPKDEEEVEPLKKIEEGDGDAAKGKTDKKDLTLKERLKLTLSLWRWGVPLIVVYFAEYAMQSGTWSAIGFPVEDEDARKTFYQNANWCYQVGVLISRSSGTVWRPKLVTLWAMPLMQVGILVLSTLNASEHWWWDNSLLASAVVVGLFGGAVYVNGFRMIGEEVKADVRELAIAGAAVSCDIGTNLGEAAGLWIQRWEEQRNGIN